MLGLRALTIVFFSREAYSPFELNERIYSCLLIDNSCRHRWRGRYNEDTILSLDVLKDGDCTIQFNNFLQEKAGTQTLQGGNTAEFYNNEGTYNKSAMLVDTHPDVAKLVWRFDRWHHEVDSVSKVTNRNSKEVCEAQRRLSNEAYSRFGCRIVIC